MWLHCVDFFRVNFVVFVFGRLLYVIIILAIEEGVGLVCGWSCN